MFPEPNIYAFAPHIFCIQNWRCKLYYLNLAYLIARSAPFIIQLLPICCRYIYANFASEVGGAICITMVGLFDCQKVRPMVYMRYSMINIWYMLFVTIFATKCGGMIRPSC